MRLTYFARAAAVAAGIALSALPVGVDLVHADPQPPPCNEDCQPGAHDRPSNGQRGYINIPGSPGVQPPTGGGPFGGRSVK